MHMFEKSIGESHAATVNAINPGPVATDMYVLMFSLSHFSHLYCILLDSKDSLANHKGFGGFRWTQSEGVEEIEAQIVNRTLAGKRIGNVDDIAPIVAFLCSSSARWITANVTCANGGLAMI